MRWPTLIAASVAAIVVIASGGVAAASGGVIPIVGIAAAGTVVLCLANFSMAGPVLLVAALPFIRPGVFSDQYNEIGLGLCFAAAVVSITDRPTATRGSAALRAVPLWSAVLYLVLLGHSTVVTGAAWRPIIQGGITTVVATSCAVVVLRDPVRCRYAVRLFVTAIAALSASYVVTVLLLGGAGAPVVYELPFRVGGSATFLAPLTPVLGETTIGGHVFPRLAGLAVEPGVMGAYIGVAIYLAPLAGWTSRTLRLLLFVGLVATISTGAFAVVVVVYAYERFLRKGHSGVRRLFGLGVSAGAVWLAFNAPVVGISQKADFNAESLGDRQDATTAGLQALLHNPLAGAPASFGQAPSSINLIAAIAAFGVLVPLAALAALLWSRRGHPRPELTTAAIGVLVLTLLSSQPTIDYVGWFILAVMAYAVALPSGSEPALVGVRSSKQPLTQRTERSDH